MLGNLLSLLFLTLSFCHHYYSFLLPPFPHHRHAPFATTLTPAHSFLLSPLPNPSLLCIHSHFLLHPSFSFFFLSLFVTQPLSFFFFFFSFLNLPTICSTMLGIFRTRNRTRFIFCSLKMVSEQHEDKNVFLLAKLSRHA